MDTKNMCLKGIGIRVQILITILSSIVNIIRGGHYDHLMIIRILTLIMNKIFIWALKIMRKVVTALTWIC